MAVKFSINMDKVKQLNKQRETWAEGEGMCVCVHTLCAWESLFSSIQ